MSSNQIHEMVGGTWLAPPLLGFSDPSLSPASCLRSVLSCILGFILYAACCLAFACSLVQLTPTWVVFTSVILAVSERGRSPERATPLTISFLVFLLFFPSNPAAFFTMADEMNTDTTQSRHDIGIRSPGHGHVQQLRTYFNNVPNGAGTNLRPVPGGMRS